MIQIGLRAHDYGCLPPEQLADVLAAYNIESIQLALTKALPSAFLPGSLSPGYARRIRKILEAKNISIAVLGCYINPVHPDPAVRARMLQNFEEHLRFARDFGCSLVGTETGSCNPDCSRHPDTGKPETFDLFCSSLERLLNTAEKCGSMVGIEPVADQHTVSSIELMSKVLARFPTPALRVIYDPVNLIPGAGLSESQEAFFTGAFDAFGPRIAAVHLKDFRMEDGKKKGDLPAGTGSLDYAALFRVLLPGKPWVDLLLENSSPATAHRTIALLRETAAAVLGTCADHRSDGGS
ncbi:MAG: sugar phosphate isomerase/epimerase [Treponema sp.]|jgi:sugar phosphate isomerase/epimerase|nr:sugar phosphate isomerase/epimerase [Treponema sp.]